MQAVTEGGRYLEAMEKAEKVLMDVRVASAQKKPEVFNLYCQDEDQARPQSGAPHVFGPNSWSFK